MVARSDITVTGLGGLIDFADPISVPPVRQVTWETRSAGRQRWKVTEPSKVVAPTTVTTALSCTLTEPVPIETDPPKGMTLPLPSSGVVTVPDWQLPKFPRTKLFSTAEVEVDERLSARGLEKTS